MWTPKKRGQNDKIRFLHVDSASPRKRADLVEKAFKKLFDKNPNVELTLKFHTHDAPGGLGMPRLDGNITKIFQTLSQDEMVQLFHEHDVLVYPSEGEGFGFIPLQALATGMPVISTGRWCSYEKYFGNNVIESTIGPTKHTGYFDGEVVLADFDSLVNLMSSVYNDISSQCNFYYQQAPKVYKKYNWENRCNIMLKSFINRMGVGILSELEGVEDGQVLVYYTGSGSYTTLDNVKFNSNNRLQTTAASVAKGLLSLDCFAPGKDHK
jgi:glycosyltransferase involved in cell wall biosynthesis